MSRRRPKQAVLVIHGIGEQMPMETLRGFVQAVWGSDERVRGARRTVWSKPDTISGSFELRRLTTGHNQRGVRTDFFELYWAHLMEGNRLSHVLSWARVLLLRWPWTVPRALRGLWLLLILAGLGAGFLFLQTVLPEPYRLLAIPPWLSGLAGGLLTALVIPTINRFAGDAARYLSAEPTNIRRRQKIRAKCIEVLEKLGRSGKYDRVVLVGHSLGSVIAYDVLTHAWARHYRERDEEGSWPLEAQERLEELARSEPIDVDRYQQLQREYLAGLRAAGNRWLVTDLVTLGSPLTHAEILLARGPDELADKMRDRELPTCPPVLEGEGFTYKPYGSGPPIPHHAAVFAPTRWTNLYFPSRWLAWGDLLSGPLAPLFGSGIRDVALRTRQQGGLFTHCLYWTPPGDGGQAAHITALREALDLLDADRPPTEP